jgi:hypothetical protein
MVLVSVRKLFSLLTLSLDDIRMMHSKKQPSFREFIVYKKSFPRSYFRQSSECWCWISEKKDAIEFSSEYPDVGVDRMKHMRRRCSSCFELTFQKQETGNPIVKEALVREIRMLHHFVND